MRRKDQQHLRVGQMPRRADLLDVDRGGAEEEYNSYTRGAGGPWLPRQSSRRRRPRLLRGTEDLSEKCRLFVSIALVQNGVPLPDRLRAYNHYTLHRNANGDVTVVIKDFTVTCG